MYDQKIKSGKTELSDAELKEQEEERIRMEKEMEEKRDDFLATSKEVLAANAKASNKEQRQALLDAEIPMQIINEVCPEEEKEKQGAEEAPKSE